MMLSYLTATCDLVRSLRGWKAAWFFVVTVTFAILALGGGMTRADAAMYLNSSEAMCNGSDGTVLMCDDFEDGVWYNTNCDTSGGVTNPDNDGWCGTIYADITPPGAAVCGSKGANSTNCAASGGPHSGGQGGHNMADHDFNNQQKVDEVYVRWYYKADPGYLWGAQKSLTFNDQYAGVGGIKWGNFSFNCAIGSPSSTANLTMGFPVPEDVCQSQNQGNNITIQSGRWYLFEIHMRLNSPVNQPDGLFELWVDDCGTDGRGCTGAQTLRMRRTDVRYPRASTAEKIGSLWWENWANPGSTGTEYYDQIVVRTRPIGPMGATASPSVPNPPSNLRAQ